MNEYAVVRMNRMEAGTLDLPVSHPRRCRYFIEAESLKAAHDIAASYWPKESLNLWVHRENITTKFNEGVSHATL